MPLPRWWQSRICDWLMEILKFQPKYPNLNLHHKTKERRRTFRCDKLLHNHLSIPRNWTPTVFPDWVSRRLEVCDDLIWKEAEEKKAFNSPIFSECSQFFAGICYYYTIDHNHLHLFNRYLKARGVRKINFHSCFPRLSRDHFPDQTTSIYCSPL